MSYQVTIRVREGMTGLRDRLIKISIPTLLLLNSVGQAIAQTEGYVMLANLGAGVNAPVFDSAGNPITGSGSYVADLFWSVNTNAVTDSLTPLGHLTSFSGTTPGYFFGGIVALPFDYLLAQVRVWDTNYGSTYYQARDRGGEFGFSNLFVVRPTPSPGQPTFLTALQSFRLQRLPHLSISLTKTNTLLLSWSLEITSYGLQQESALDAGSWIALTNRSIIVNSQNLVIIPKPQENLFYRLISR